MNDIDDVLLHICIREEWDRARAGHDMRPASLTEAGFVHLSTRRQVHLPANRLFTGRTDLVLLVLDPQRLGAPVRWEPGVPQDPGSMVFPHLYGPLPIDAVTDVVDYRPDTDGAFAPPAL